jgi:peroxiredoxin
MSNAPRWSAAILLIAAFYNLAWGLMLVASPVGLFQASGMIVPNAPDFLRVLGLLIGVLGLGYGMAALKPIQYWPIVLMGLLSKLGAAALTGWGIVAGRLPKSMWWAVLANDLIWVAPFGAILYLAHDRLLNQKRLIAPEVVRMALRARTQHEVTLDELTRLSPVLLVFLRHAGCTFCREALSDLAERREEIEKAGTRLVLVHMGTEEQGRGFFARYRLDQVPRVSDRGRALYRAFGLRRGGLADLFGPKVWVRGFQAGILNRHGVGRLAGDGFQMPGVFLLYHSEIIRSYRHQSAADRPDYMAIVTGKHYAQPELSS